jgi:hypothetical protein
MSVYLRVLALDDEIAVGSCVCYVARRDNRGRAGFFDNRRPGKRLLQGETVAMVYRGMVEAPVKID